MRRSQKAKLLHRRQKLVVDHLRRIQRPRMDRLESHRANLGQARQRLSRPGNLADALVDGRR